MIEARELRLRQQRMRVAQEQLVKEVKALQIRVEMLRRCYNESEFCALGLDEELQSIEHLLAHASCMLRSEQVKP